jgi:hypothetical protein
MIPCPICQRTLQALGNTNFCISCQKSYTSENLKEAREQEEKIPEHMVKSPSFIVQKPSTQETLPND